MNSASFAIIVALTTALSLPAPAGENVGKPPEPLILLKKIVEAADPASSLRQMASEVLSSDKTADGLRLFVTSGLYEIGYSAENDTPDLILRRINIKRLDRQPMFTSESEAAQVVSALGLPALKASGRTSEVLDSHGQLRWSFYIARRLDEIALNWYPNRFTPAEVFSRVQGNYECFEMSGEQIRSLLCTLLSAPSPEDKLRSWGQVKRKDTPVPKSQGKTVSTEHMLSTRSFQLSYSYQYYQASGTASAYGFELKIESKGPAFFKDREAAKQWMKLYFESVSSDSQLGTLIGANGVNQKTVGHEFKMTIDEQLKECDLEWDEVESLRLSRFCK